MVLSVCRQILGDLHAADDAFQATFLVLIRRSGSFAVPSATPLARGSTAWLTGPPSRRGGSPRRRRVRERRVAVPAAAGSDCGAELDDLRSLLHEEVNRLPAKYRAPVVLCYFEGRTHEEAAGASTGRWGPLPRSCSPELVTFSDRGSPAAASRPPRSSAPPRWSDGYREDRTRRGPPRRDDRPGHQGHTSRGQRGGLVEDHAQESDIRSIKDKCRGLAWALALLGTGAGAVVRKGESRFNRRDGPRRESGAGRRGPVPQLA